MYFISKDAERVTYRTNIKIQTYNYEAADLSEF